MGNAATLSRVRSGGVGANWMVACSVDGYEKPYHSRQSHSFHLPIMTLLFSGWKQRSEHVYDTCKPFVVGPTSVVTWKSFCLRTLFRSAWATWWRSSL